MIDLGSKNCIPCKQMAPILEELKQDYKHKFETIFIDVNENGAESAKYNIRLIPTQIFFDENGKEIHRHVGFMSKEAILQAWHDLGYDF
ncbi:MAG: thioredoxin family protein [Planctomycetes bacterium]|nr:thioredoxin family protein [Planctomycetota bacterium]